MKKILLVLIATVVSFKSYSIDRYTISNLVDELKPAVVRITGLVEDRSSESSYEYNPFAKYNSNSKSKFISKENSTASGVIISSDGYVITNNHAVAVSDSLKVEVNGKKYDAKVVGVDKATDLALLKIDTYDAFNYVTLANSDQVRVGELVFAIGSPYGLENSVSSGIISGVNRKIGATEYEDFLQTDTSLNPGNSGGPLFNLDGQIIGINTASMSKTGGSDGIGFAIASNLVKKIIKQLKSKGSVKRGWFGLELSNIDLYTKNKLGLKDTSGALIYNVIKNTPAHLAGLKVGDVIVKYNINDVTSVRQIRSLMENTKIRSKVKIGVIRNGKYTPIKIEFIEENKVYAKR